MANYGSKKIDGLFNTDRIYRSSDDNALIVRRSL